TPMPSTGCSSAAKVVGSFSMIPLLLGIIEKDPTFVPAYKTLGQIFVRSHDEAGLIRVLSNMQQRFRPIALAEYYDERWSPQIAWLYKGCADSPETPAACFDLWKAGGSRRSDPPAFHLALHRTQNAGRLPCARSVAKCRGSIRPGPTRR